MKKNSKSKFCKLDEFSGKRISRKINATIKNKSRAIDEESSLLDDAKSTDFNSKLEKHDLWKPLNMKDQIRELLRQLVVINKKKIEYENSQNFERNYDIPHFVTMKDINISEDSKFFN